MMSDGFRSQKQTSIRRKYQRTVDLLQSVLFRDKINREKFSRRLAYQSGERAQ